MKGTRLTYHFRHRIFLLGFAGLLVAGVMAQQGQQGQDGNAAGPFTTAVAPKYEYTLLARSVKDECVKPQQGLYPNLQAPYTPMPANGICPSGLVRKANQSRIWASAVNGNGLWIGTAPNYFAMGFGEMPDYMWGSLPSLPSTRASVNSSNFLAEWGNSAFYKERVAAAGLYPAVDAQSGDWRPPRIYRYDLVKGTLVDKSPTSGNALELINQTEGIRAGGTVTLKPENGGQKIVFLAGLSIIGGNVLPGVKIFAYSENTGQLLAARNFPEYSNVRQMLTIGNDIYIAVFGPGGDQAQTGWILHWIGDPAKTAPEDVLAFETVGVLPVGSGAPGELTYSPVSGRIYATTWAYATPPNVFPGFGAALLESPTSHPPNEPFTAIDAVSPYVQRWRASQYSRDLAITMIIGGGAMAAYGDYVYWGTMSAPATGPAAYWSFRANTAVPNAPPPTPSEVLEGNEKAQMPLTLWRMNVNTNTVELLYGAEQVPVFDYFGTRTWSMAPTGWTPKWGPAGFGNPFNYYTWTMKVFNGKLWVGTSDCSYPAVDVDATMFQPAKSASGLTEAQFAKVAAASSSYLYGADLVRFNTPESPGVFESVGGLGNYLNVGFRTMVTDGKALYLGTENFANINARGGWELIKLYSQNQQ